MLSFDSFDKRKEVSLSSRGTMTGVVRLRWHKARGGHEVREHPAFGRHAGGDLWVTPKALRGIDVNRGDGYHEFLAKMPVYEARLGEHEIYKDLANTHCTPEGAVAFADRWGLLDRETWFRLDSFYEVVASMKAAIEDGETGGDTAVARSFSERLEVPNVGIRHARSQRKAADPCYAGTLTAHFEWQSRGDRRSDKPHLYFSAGTLWQFCLLERLHALVGGVDVKSCAHCGAFLRMPLMGRPSKYCKNACRHAAHRQRKRAGNDEHKLNVSSKLQRRK